ncbi:nicotinate phosphoribosyltransferase [Marinilabiliaceae bacterium JC040]|nr:nicotinate phosphoribosyltransferase [Marinilabiliaceae bacterium JC040]
MIFEPIITSILDNDLYKFTMMNAVIHHFPRALVKYKFFERTKKLEFPKGFSKELKEQIDHLATLSLTVKEEKWLKETCGYYLPPTFFIFLRGYRFNPKQVSIEQIDGKLDLTIEGPWHEAILWEVVLMALISELYFRMTNNHIKDTKSLNNKDHQKAIIYKEKNICFADFGTRRRYSLKNHDRVIEVYKNDAKGSFVGTSNMFLAMKHNLIPIGTHAHEWFMFMAAKYGYRQANREGLGKWVETYGGELGIALSDTFTTKAFLKSFNTLYAKLFDGTRHDSGDPIEYTNKMLKHYKSLGIDPKYKTIVFSNNLNPEEVFRISEYCKDKIQYSFGIGTNTTNDVGVTPLNIVIKMTHAMPDGFGEYIPTVKLSDDNEKHTGPIDEIDLCEKDLRINNN